MDRDIDNEQEAGAHGRRGIGALATITLGLAVFSAVALVGHTVERTHAQTTDDMGKMTQSMSGVGAGGDVPPMMGSGQGTGDVGQMVKLCTRYMQDMSSMMRSMHGQPSPEATPGG